MKSTNNSPQIIKYITNLITPKKPKKGNKYYDENGQLRQQNIGWEYRNE